MNYLLIGLSAITSLNTAIIMHWLGNKNIKGWYLSLVNQGFWITITILTGAWGFMPLNIWLTFVAIRSIHRWRRSSNSEKERRDGD